MNPGSDSNYTRGSDQSNVLLLVLRKLRNKDQCAQ